MKRATRYKAEVRDLEGTLHWEVLVHDGPTAHLRSVLRNAGFDVVRAASPLADRDDPLNYSDLDPVSSIKAAREHAARRPTQRAKVLLLLLEQAPLWVSRSRIREVGGDSGDKRARELRALNWPIEIRQLDRNAAWHIRLNDDELLRALSKLDFDDESPQ